MDLQKIHDTLRAQYEAKAKQSHSCDDCDEIHIYESERRILMGIQFAIDNARIQNYEIEKLRTAIVNRFVADNTPPSE